jgi:hypothetical protein
VFDLNPAHQTHVARVVTAATLGTLTQLDKKLGHKAALRLEQLLVYQPTILFIS